MSVRSVSVRLEADTLARLEAESKRAGQSRAQFMTTLLEEGLRMEAHPGIVFRSGPAGRRPGLAGGPDVWEVVRAFRGLELRDEDAVARLAAQIGLAPEQVWVALRYYAEHRAEVDAWIDRVDEEAAGAEAAWQR